MKFLKYLVLFLLIILLGAGAYVALLKSNFVRQKEFKINAPRELVFQEINNLRAWKNRLQIPKNTLETLSENTSGEGAFLKWENDSLDFQFHLENKEVIYSSKIFQRAEATKGLAKTNYKISWSFHQNEADTDISVEVEIHLNYWKKLFTLFNDQALEEDLNKQTENLNRIIKEKMKVYTINVDGVKTTKDQKYIFTVQALKNDPEIVYKKALEQNKNLEKFLKDFDLRADGSPFIIYNEIDRNHDNVIISFGIPVKLDKDILLEDSQSGILTGSLSGKRVIKATLKGDYKNIPKLWTAVKTYMIQNHLKQDTELKPYEVFKITELETANPAEWITELFIPIKDEEENNNLPAALILSDSAF